MRTETQDENEADTKRGCECDQNLGTKTERQR